MATAPSELVSASDVSSGMGNWIGWWIMSPVITASWPAERIRTLWCPGVWPGVGSRYTSSVRWWSESTSIDRPAATIGVTESPITSP